MSLNDFVRIFTVAARTRARWHLVGSGMLRSVGRTEHCPLTFLAVRRGWKMKRSNVASHIDAGIFLGLKSRTALRIADATDGLPRFESDKDLRTRLLRAARIG